jgi:hypothetical protein
LTWLLNFSLIHFLDFYFLLLFFVGTARRLEQYRHIVQLVVVGPGRWPNLLKLVREHRTIFFTVSTLLPGLLALALSLAQLIASRWIWPEAGRPPHGLTVGRLSELWPMLFLIVPLGIAMFSVDIYGIVAVGQIDRPQMEKYFDQAEYWLRSRTAHVVRVFTLGYVDPRKMVNDEVRKALVVVTQMLNTNLWWITVQMGLRVSFCLSLWLTWAFAATG